MSATDSTSFAQRVRNRIQYQLLGDRGLDRRKVICLGLSRTGTSSLSVALANLGIPTVHFPPIYKVETDGSLSLDWKWWFGMYDGFTDISVVHFFRELDSLFPQTKYILTKRELSSWLRSCSVHFAEPSKDPDIFGIRKNFYGSATYDESRFTETYENHHRTVIDYFADRQDDLLEVDICKGETMARLCDFLKLPHPADLAYPHLNAQKKKA
ncbi:MAG: sulfotransferase family protein [Verrucomicrobiota bacterium]